MMSMFRNRLLGTAALLAMAAGLTGCDDFLDVKNPNNLEAEAIDEERDRTLLSQSVWQAFVARHGEINVYVAWFTHEARVGDTFPTRNEYGRRDVGEASGHHGQNWSAPHSTIQFAEEVIRRIEPSGNTLDLARAYLASGFSIMVVGQHYCEATLAESWTVPRGPLTSQQMMDSAIVRFQAANTIASGLSGAEATAIANAALVGIARAHLQNGRNAQASQVAAQVPANFVFNLLHMDDPSNRGTLGNTIWLFSESRISLVVPPEFIAMADAGDPRIAYVNMGRPSQDGVLTFIRQDKYKGWGDPERLASGLEAQYIKVEADGNPTEMLAFINARRAVGNQAPMAATNDMDALLRELMEQKTRDFWLEGKRLADFRRNPNHVPYIIPPGNTYYKPAVGQVSDQTCWPVPLGEKNNNPLWPKS
jgi:starch-binding outer membrane protein, SusD/RagB family